MSVRVKRSNHTIRIRDFGIIHVVSVISKTALKVPNDHLNTPYTLVYNTHKRFFFYEFVLNG